MHRARSLRTALTAPGARAWADRAARGGDLAEVLEPRRPDCPLCRSTHLRVRVRTPDVWRGRDGHFVLEECGDCGHLFQNPRLTAAGLALYASSLPPPRDRGVDGTVGRHRERALALRSIAEPSRWFDVGAGHRSFRDVARTVWPQARLEGIDPAEAGSSTRRWVDGGLDALVGDLDASEQGYDVVSLHDYLEHARDPFTDLDVAARLVAPGGHLIVELPDPTSLEPLVPGRRPPRFEPRYQHVLSVDNLEWALGERGFTPVAHEVGHARPVELESAVDALVARLVPPADVPGRAAPDLVERSARAFVHSVHAPVRAAAALVDQAAASVIRAVHRARTYRVVARCDEVVVPPATSGPGVVIDLRDSIRA